jgi:hypothetical protein
MGVQRNVLSLSDVNRDLKLIRIFAAIILQAGSVLLDNFFKTRDVLQKAFAGEA